jgi:DNA gyrase/topoisomerase IV subunit A
MSKFVFPFQLMSLKLELDSRPTQEDFDEKVQQCNALRLELSNLTEQMACNEKLLEQMQNELDEERERQMEMLQKHLEERAMQTEDVESTKEVPAERSSGSVLSESPPKSAAEASHQIKSSTALPQLPARDEIDHEDDDDALNNHPKVLYEDELIVFKEKCTNLASENIRLQREIGELRANMSHFHNNWLHNFMLKYLVPVLIVFVAYIFYLLK